MEHTKTKGCLDSLTIKLLAMALMLCDHLWATVLPGVMWLTAVGRIAFPIFAFQVAEGFQRTHDRKKYLLRMLVFALISEIPFNYLYYSSPVFPFHQNVMFTFFIALLLMLGLEKVRSKGAGMYILAAVLSLPVGYFLGTIGMVDVDNYDYLEKYGENLYNLLPGGNRIATDANIEQGTLETSNVNVVNEMVNMITIQRAYEAGQKVITSIDGTLDRAVNNVGKV